MRRLFAVLALATAVACGESSGTDPGSATIAGTYSLTTVNGKPLPFVYQEGNVTATLTADVITLSTTNTWTETYAYTIGGLPQTGSGEGTVRRTGNSLTLMLGSLQVYHGTIEGNSLSLTDDFAAYVFTK